MRAPTPSRYPFVAAWGLASAIGLAIAGMLAGTLAPSGGDLPVVFAPSLAEGIRHYGPPTAAAMGMWGAGLGAAQWVVVRGRLRGAGWWAPATLAGWGLAGAIIGSLTGALNGRLSVGAHDAGPVGVAITVSLSVLALGLIPATFQWLVLRHSSQLWGSYSLRHMIGLVAGGMALWVVASALGLNLPSGPAWAVGGAAMGAIIGLATARPVVRAVGLGAEGRVR